MRLFCWQSSLQKIGEIIQKSASENTAGAAAAGTSGSDCTPVEIQIINYNLTEDELKFFSGMGSNVRPDQKLPLKIVTAEDLLY